jgi:uncharacterized protein (DUF2225 family)
MTTLFHQTIACPVCQKPFESAIVGSCGFVDRDSDLCPQYWGANPLSHFVHSCPACGYSGHEDDFDREVTPELCEQVRTKITPRLGRGAGVLDKWRFAVWCGQWGGRMDLELARLCLTASWCCRSIGEHEEERKYQKRAIRFLKAALAKDEVPGDERAVCTYLVGELYRRLGDREWAEVWLAKVPGEVSDKDEEQWLLNLAARQRRSPRASM